MTDTTPARRPSSTPAARRPSSTPAAKREARSEELRRLLHVVSPTSDVELTARKRCEEEGIDDIRQLRQLYDRGISLSDKLPLGVALELSHLFEEERADDDRDCVHVSSSADALAAVGANGAVISGLLLVLNVAQAGNEGHVGGVLGFGVAPYSNASLVFRFVSDPPLKFVIRLISSC